MARMVGKRGLVVLVAVVAVAVAAGVAYATVVLPATGSAGSLTGCVLKENGAVRIVSSRVQCRPGETVVTFATPSAPTVETVNCGTGQSLQHAIDAADTTQPVTISIVGTCAESVLVARDQVTLRSGSPGSGVSGSLTFTGRRETVSDITVTGGGDDPVALHTTDGGSLSATNVHVIGVVGADNNATVGLGNATIAHSDSGCGVDTTSGGSIYVDSTTVTGCSVDASSDSSVWLNGVTVSGGGGLVGGVSVGDGASAILTNDTISSSTYFVVNVDGGSATLNNTAVSGGTNGVGVHDGGYANVIDGSVISGNGLGIIADTGGHVVVGSDNSEAGGGVVKNNTGDGIEIVGASTLQIGDPAKVTGNGGDGISLSDTSVGSLNDPIVTGNGGWGVHCDTAPSVAVTRGPTDSVTGNTAGQVDCPNAGQPG